jgi:long-chain fatty acid transport protein
MRKIFFILGISALVFSSSVSAAGLADTYGIGMRAMALGGAFTAVADNYAAAYYNPAGLAQSAGHHVTLEYMYTHPKIDIKTLDGQELDFYDNQGNVAHDPDECHYGKGLDIPFPILGLVLDLNDIVNLPVNVQLGVAASLPEEFNVQVRINDIPPDLPQLIRYGDQVDRATLVVSAGAEVLPGLLYVGGGVNGMWVGSGTTYVNGITIPQTNYYVNGEQKSPSIMMYDPLAGILITPLDGKVKVGFSWKDEQLFAIDPSYSYGAALLLGQQPAAQYGIMSIVGYSTPEEYDLGLSLDFGKAMVSIEASKQLWSRFENTSVNAKFYEDPGFRNTINYRAGLEYELNEKTNILLGFCHQPTPVPDQSGKISNYLDMDKDMFSIGGNYSFPITERKVPVKVEGMFQYQKLDDLTVYKNGEDGPVWEDQQSYTVKSDGVYTGGLAATISW